ncbi:Progestin and adipoQ receptor family member 3like, partial [Caligus rogercresseyi]
GTLTYARATGDPSAFGTASNPFSPSTMRPSISGRIFWDSLFSGAILSRALCSRGLLWGLVAYQATMILSALFHVFTCHSKSLSESCLSLDLLGISVCLLATYLSGIYYAFYCDTYWRNFYLLSVGGISVLAVAAQLWPKITQEEYTVYRQRWRQTSTTQIYKILEDGFEND